MSRGTIATGVQIHTNTAIQHTTDAQATTTANAVTVGTGQQAQGAQAPRGLPGIQLALGKNLVTVGDVFRNANSYQSSLNISSSLKAKIGFFGFLQKILPNSLASKLDSKVHVQDFKLASNLASTYAAQQQQTNPPASTAEMRHTLTDLKEALTNQGANHPDQVRNLAEMVKLVDGELAKLDMLDMSNFANVFVGHSQDKANFHAEVVAIILQGLQDHPSAFGAGSSSSELSGEMRTLMGAHLQQAANATQDVVNSGAQKSEGGHKQVLSQFQSLIEKEVDDTQSEGTLFRGNSQMGKLMGQLTHAQLPESWKSLVTGYLDHTSGLKLEVDPVKYVEIYCHSGTEVTTSVRAELMGKNDLQQHEQLLESAVKDAITSALSKEKGIQVATRKEALMEAAAQEVAHKFPQADEILKGILTDVVSSAIDTVFALAQDECDTNVDILKAEFNQIMQEMGIVSDPTARNAKAGLVTQELADEMKVMYEAVKAKFGEDQALKSVAANLMLRGMAPALMAPQNQGLLTPENGVTQHGVFKPSSDMQRNLTLISKMVQNAANGVEFGAKEPFMAVFNQTVSDRFSQFTDFAAAVVARGRMPDEI